MSANPPQPHLFAEPRLTYCRKDQICPPGTFTVIPLAVLADARLTPADKCVYGALLDHLRGASLWVYPSIGRLAAMCSLSERAVRRSVRRLVGAAYIDTRRSRTGPLLYAFGPVSHIPGSTALRDVPPPLISEVKGPPEEPGQSSAEGTECPAPRQIVRTPRTNCPHPPDNLSGKALGRSTPVNTSASAGFGNWTKNEAVDEALEWEELLGLSGQLRSEQQEETDFDSLHQAAADMYAGQLGPVDAGTSILRTLAHQIGRRQPAPRSLVGMFLAEVGRMRIRAMRTGKATAVKQGGNR